jgi:hypothetical protein
VLDGCDPQTVRNFNEQSAALVKNPKDDRVLVNCAVYTLRLARTSRYDTFLIWLAAKDLEQAIRIDPNEWTAWHNYADVNYSARSNDRPYAKGANREATFSTRHRYESRNRSR